MIECLQFTESYKYSQKLKNRLWVIGKQKAQNTTVDSRTFHLSFSFISALRKQHYTLCSVQESLMSCRLQLNPHFSVRSSGDLNFLYLHHFLTLLIHQAAMLSENTLAKQAHLSIILFSVICYFCFWATVVICNGKQ